MKEYFIYSQLYEKYITSEFGLSNNIDIFKLHYINSDEFYILNLINKYLINDDDELTFSSNEGLLFKFENDYLITYIDDEKYSFTYFKNDDIIILTKLNKKSLKIKLIENNQIHNIIVGPHLFSYYNKFNLLLLGEEHIFIDDTSNGTRVDKWILDLLNNKNINLYIEQNINTFYNYEKTYLSKIINNLSNSIFDNNKLVYNCIDIRQISNNIYSFSKLYINDSENMNNISSILEDKYSKKYSDIISYIMGYNRSNINKLLIKEFEYDLLNNLSNYYQLIEFGDYNIDLYMDDFFKLIDNEKLKIKNFDEFKFYSILEEIYYNLYQKYDLLFSLRPIPMDIYFLLKFLANYSDDIFNSITIVYTGYHHSEIYIEFLNKWFSIKPDNYICNNFKIQQNITLQSDFII